VANMPSLARQKACEDIDLYAARLVLTEWDKHEPGSMMRIWAALRVCRARTGDSVRYMPLFRQDAAVLGWLQRAGIEEAQNATR
jgi:hypothetical protein